MIGLAESAARSRQTHSTSTFQASAFGGKTLPRSHKMGWFFVRPIQSTWVMGTPTSSKFGTPSGDSRQGEFFWTSELGLGSAVSGLAAPARRSRRPRGGRRGGGRWWGVPEELGSGRFLEGGGYFRGEDTALGSLFSHQSRRPFHQGGCSFGSSIEGGSSMAFDGHWPWRTLGESTFDPLDSISQRSHRARQQLSSWEKWCFILGQALQATRVSGRGMVWVHLVGLLFEPRIGCRATQGGYAGGDAAPSGESGPHLRGRMDMAGVRAFSAFGFLRGNR